MVFSGICHSPPYIAETINIAALAGREAVRVHQYGTTQDVREHEDMESTEILGWGPGCLHYLSPFFENLLGNGTDRCKCSRKFDARATRIYAHIASLTFDWSQTDHATPINVRGITLKAPETPGTAVAVKATDSFLPGPRPTEVEPLVAPLRLSAPVLLAKSFAVIPRWPRRARF